MSFQAPHLGCLQPVPSAVSEQHELLQAVTRWVGLGHSLASATVAPAQTQRSINDAFQLANGVMAALQPSSALALWPVRFSLDSVAQAAALLPVLARGTLSLAAIEARASADASSLLREVLVVRKVAALAATEDARCASH